MSQHDYNIANQGFPGARTDLNNALGAIATNNSGASAPSTTFAHQWWYDSTANILKMRNAANDGWINMAVFDQSTNTWRLPAAALSEVDGNIIPDGNGTRALGSAAAAWSGVFTREINSGPLAGFRNAIINGGFDIWQRGTSFSNPADGAYLADRWYLFRNGSGATVTASRQAFTLGQTDVPDEPQYFFRYDQSVAGSGGTFNGVAQQIEGVRTFAGRQVTVSFWAKGASVFNIGARLTQVFGTGGSPSSSVGTTVLGTTALTTSWARYSATVTLPSISGKTLGTNGNDSLALGIDLPINTTFTFDLARVQVELGPVATPFERRPIGVEEALCQRYLPAFNWVSGNNVVGIGYSFSTTQSIILMPFATTPRVVPTGATVTNVGNFTLINGSAVAGTPTTIALGSVSSLLQGQLLVTTTAGTPTIAAGDGAQLYATAAAQILFTGCEL